MTPEDIQKCIHDGIAKALADQLAIAVNTAVDRSVNGKIKALDEKVTPIVDAYKNWLSARRVAFIFVGFLLALGSFISSAQAIWSIVSNYLVVSVK